MKDNSCYLFKPTEPEQLYIRNNPTISSNSLDYGKRLLSVSQRFNSIPRLQITENVIARSNSDKAISNLVAQEIARVAFGNSATTLRDVLESSNRYGALHQNICQLQIK